MADVKMVNLTIEGRPVTVPDGLSMRFNLAAFLVDSEPSVLEPRHFVPWPFSPSILVKMSL